jgi:hypothetical protein
MILGTGNRDPILFTVAGKMIKAYLKSLLDKEAANLGESVDWAKYIVDKAIIIFFKYLLAFPLLAHWKFSPAKAISVARLISVKSEDCGSCVQIEINMAKKRNVEPEFIRNALRKDYERLGESYRDVALFTEAVISKNGLEIEIGNTLKKHFGEKAFLEIALAISTARFYPTIKRALGFSTECKLENFRI